MESKKEEIDLMITPTKAMRDLTDLFEQQGQRLNLMEQQFLDLAARISSIEGTKYKNKSFR